MGCCITSALCCAGACCCKLLCAPFERLGVAAKNFAKIGYVAHQVFWVLVSLLLMVSAKKLVDWFPVGMLDCPDTSGGGSSCLGTSSIIRMSFALFIFHAIIFCTVLTRSSIAATFHDGCWCAKMLFLGGFFTASMWISNDFMKVYMQISQVLSSAFLVYQAVLMMAVAYTLNEKLVKNYEKDSGECSKYILIFVSLVFLGLTVWQVVAQYIQFVCPSDRWIMTVTLVAVVFIHVIIFFRPRPDASLLTSSIASVYMLYLQWSALSSDTS